MPLEGELPELFTLDDVLPELPELTGEPLVPPVLSEEALGLPAFGDEPLEAEGVGEVAPEALPEPVGLEGGWLPVEPVLNDPDRAEVVGADVPPAGVFSF